jgi:amino acid permease
VARQSMAELKIGTYMLFTGIISLLIVMQLKIYNEGSYSSRTAAESQTVSEERTFESYLDSFNICITSYGFVLTLFPVYSSMRKDNRHNFHLSLYLALGIVFTLYLALTVSAMTYFGAANVKSSIFDNFSELDDLLS